MESSGLPLLNQDVAHGLDVPVSVVWWVFSLISTRVCVVMTSSCTKTDSGVTPDIIESLLVIPILALECGLSLQIALNPSLLHLVCKEARGPISDFHEVRPSEVKRYWPSAISEYSEMACLWMVMNLILWPIFIPRQILEKGVFQ